MADLTLFRPEAGNVYVDVNEKVNVNVNVNINVNVHVNVNETADVYEKWNNIPHYTKTEKYGRGPCEPSLTSYYMQHS